MNTFQCYHNNRGHCQYGEKCRYQHYKITCEKIVCTDGECKFRHPKVCKYRDSCKYLRKQICAYKHEVFKCKNNLKTTEKVKEYEDEMKQLKYEIVRTETVNFDEIYMNYKLII